MATKTPPTKRKYAGRPTKLEPAAVDKIVTALRSGAWRYVAARWAGVSPRVFREWMAKGKRQPKSVFAAFRRSVIEAETTAEIKIGAVIFKEASVNAEVALKYLSVRHRKRWSERHRVEHSGPDATPIQVVLETYRGARLEDLG